MPEPVARARAGQRLVGSWLLATGVVLVMPGPMHGLRLTLLALHLVLAHLLFDRPFPGRGLVVGRAPAAVLADWGPLLIAPLFYWEAPLLADVLHGPVVYDAVVQHWDAWLFGVQPSEWLAATRPWLWLSEPLHAAYLSYYLFALLPPVVFYFSGRRAAFRRLGFTIALAFVVHSALFAIFPVLGPRYVFAGPHGALEGGLFYTLAHRVLEAGSSPGTAFPSSHVGLAAAVTVALHREAPRLTPWTTFLTVALAIGTVYGGFHYAADAIAGAVLGVTLGLVAPTLMDALDGISAGARSRPAQP